MAVYVSRREYAFKSKKGFMMKLSHMMADDIEELHAFAISIGVKLDWFQRDAKRPHYDISKAFKQKAIARGAIEVDDRQLLLLLQNKTLDGDENLQRGV